MLCSSNLSFRSYQLFTQTGSTTDKMNIQDDPRRDERVSGTRRNNLQSRGENKLIPSSRDIFSFAYRGLVVDESIVGSGNANYESIHRVFTS
jgi:hypothetical protein